jgi:alkylation response protein AidB-like acyl-CoA dehydrogenase
VDKEEARGTYEHLPKIRTHGIRGADISGIRLRDAPYHGDPIGGEGAALSILLKTFAVTRTLIASIAVGAGDSALRIVVNFARSRRLYRGTVLQISHARSVLSDSFADLLACEAASLAGARALHAAPEQATFWASVLKFHVPTTVERLVGELAIVLGARYYLREAHAEGMFQKIQRDVCVLGLFDGSTLVNLYSVALHAPAIPRGSSAAVPLGDAPRLLDPLVELDPRRLSIAARAVCGADALARYALAHLEGRSRNRGLPPLLQRLESEALRLQAELSASTLRNQFDMSADLVALSSRYARLACLALAANVFVRSRLPGSALFEAGDWLVLALARALPDCALDRHLVESCREELLRVLLDMEARGHPFSLLSECRLETAS